MVIFLILGFLFGGGDFLLRYNRTGKMMVVGAGAPWFLDFVS